MAMTQQQPYSKTRPAASLITQEELQKYVSYDPESGVMTWLVDHYRNAAGSVVGHLNSKGYLEITLRRKRYLVHRLAFVLMTGQHPVEVDHINGDRANNRWANLRDVTPAENSKNMKLADSNRSGMYGVNYCKRTGDWIVSIRVNGKTIRIGRYNHKFFAKQARKAAEIKYGYHPNHGRKTVVESA